VADIHGYPAHDTTPHHPPTRRAERPQARSPRRDDPDLDPWF